MRKILLGLLVGVAVVVLAVGALFALGYVHIGFKAPGQKAHVSYSVCSGDITNQFNTISSDSSQAESKRFTDLATRIKGVRHSPEDPTCQTILFFAAFRTEDYQGMSQPMQLVQGLYDKGIYADSNLESGYSVKAMSALLKEVVSDTKSS